MPHIQIGYWLHFQEMPRTPVPHQQMVSPGIFAVIGCEHQAGSSTHDATIDTPRGVDAASDPLPYDFGDMGRVPLALCLHTSSFSGSVTTTWCSMGDVCCRLQFILPAGYHDSEGNRPFQCQPQAYCADGGAFDAGVVYVSP